jgi:putative zinc finger/helix-turn-helix YgiT family protein
MKNQRVYPDCYKCGSKVEERRHQAVVCFEGEEILFQRVPLGVCKRCGERFLTAKTARLMEHALVLCHPMEDVTPAGIRTLREALNLTREAFAARLGVSSQSIFRWETGRARPARSALTRIEALRKKKTRKRRAG